MLTDQYLMSLSCMFLEALSLRRVTDVQQYDSRIIDVMKADSVISSMACCLLTKLANDEA